MKEDLISRQTVLDALEDYMDRNTLDGYEDSRALIEILKALPSAQPERKMAKWNFVGDQMFECTECGTCYTQSQFQQMRVMITDPDFPRFCPTCGADMREEGGAE